MRPYLGTAQWQSSGEWSGVPLPRRQVLCTHAQICIPNRTGVRSFMALTNDKAETGRILITKPQH